MKNAEVSMARMKLAVGINDEESVNNIHTEVAAFTSLSTADNKEVSNKLSQMQESA